MKEFRGTPGPWVAEKTSRAVGPVSKDDDQSYGMCLPVAWVEFDQEVEIQAANQNLMAAAPELLEALQLSISVIKNMADPSQSKTFTLELANAAIAKALGK